MEALIFYPQSQLFLFSTKDNNLSWMAPQFGVLIPKSYNVYTLFIFLILYAACVLCFFKFISFFLDPLGIPSLIKYVDEFLSPNLEHQCGWGWGFWWEAFLGSLHNHLPLWRYYLMCPADGGVSLLDRYCCLKDMMFYSA